MLTEERHQIILKQLQLHNIVKLQDLIPLTGASESTLRRDLQDLEECHKLLRIYGGAQSIVSFHDEPALSQKITANPDAKARLGKVAGEFVKDNEVIFLDAGTTVQTVIPYLAKLTNILVVTNSVVNASTLADYQIETFVPGGRLKSSTKAIVGSSMTKTLENYHFDKAFIGTNGFSVKAGFTTPDPEEASTKEIALQNSVEKFILADSSKCGQISFSRFANLNEATLITNELPVKSLELLNKYTKVMEVK
ncbi:DeoR/GlpR family DNA-binding transcription regulator [Companilactobacillus sp.]|uniref:DeoR/GlpR family DNA-binding transcription regulator n=1 Tax=Companilactobacillus sp. TaxID=2767905 RepID=UPI0025C31DBE|nr:DeoR/GlpR family DNA-binding transcription regulator [Companilactobacillus sp.]MCH4008341.1 DeoR/GlpR family DNA-binding transcription regulator [Companilactobacillus sp.]MCH4051480.1 DeoR/GlpR family DNA-binding transcription regulator [Companilactobacillus sp.]MCH4076284.1 DeoR/GlpR family DNA-binding transcription regulator [Companilactobacillus sp.]MCH4124859.1 DeoR/GlpR family DNA-binding transcription regulator [Companilactobacillus sp.]MCH4131401.1 DeoR/GlpR family DNA-binding transc